MRQQRATEEDQEQDRIPEFAALVARRSAVSVPVYERAVRHFYQWLADECMAPVTPDTWRAYRERIREDFREPHAMRVWNILAHWQAFTSSLPPLPPFRDPAEGIRAGRPLVRIDVSAAARAEIAAFLAAGAARWKPDPRAQRLRELALLRFFEWQERHPQRRPLGASSVRTFLVAVNPPSGFLAAHVLRGFLAWREARQERAPG